MNNRTKGIAFEQYVRQILESNGIITQSTIASNDYGADIVLSSNANVYQAQPVSSRFKR